MALLISSNARIESQEMSRDSAVENYFDSMDSVDAIGRSLMLL